MWFRKLSNVLTGHLFWGRAKSLHLIEENRKLSHYTWRQAEVFYWTVHEVAPYTYISPSDLYDTAPHCVLGFLVKVDFRIIKCIKDVNEKWLSLQLIVSSFNKSEKFYFVNWMFAMQFKTFWMKDFSRIWNLKINSLFQS